MKKIFKILNKQINKEFFSSYLYLSMSYYFESQGLKGFANWMSIQSQEERDHALVFANTIIKLGGKVEFEQIEKPEINFSSPLLVFEKSLEHEKLITKSIEDILLVCKEEKFYNIDTILNWFLNEQIEEEENVLDVIKKLQLIKNDGNGLLMLDKELSTRTYTKNPMLANE